MKLDTVRIDLDMDAGTMAYTINGESQVTCLSLRIYKCALACTHIRTRARARTVSLSSGKLIATYTGTYARIPFILSQYHA